ncbi:manganese efflux pump MntP [Bacillus shivajii]|uniref:manganese efflux pump MntP n=1 Tax=Bacillus shivajii TaxID=1983719 RepID=UPI0021F57676|nr:manganese efflux pump [Bacillus shivajii]
MLWQILILVVASNLDDLGVGFSLGMKYRLSWQVIWIISILSGLTMAFGLFIGNQFSLFFSGDFPMYLAAFVFAAIGFWFIWQGQKGSEHEETIANKKYLNLGWKGAILLGIVLGIDSVAAGVSGGLTNLPILLTSVLAWFTSFLFIWFGSRFGRFLAAKVIRDYADYFAGVLFILLAAYIIIF